jgi:hypothetical protein
MSRRVLATAALLVVPLLAGCGDGSSPPTPACCPTTSPRSPHPTTVPPAFVPHRAVARPAGWRLPVASARQAVIGVGRAQVLLAGGLVAGDASTARVERVRLQTGTVSAEPWLDVPVHDTAGGLVGGEPAVVGGGNATEQSAVQVFDGDAWRVAGHLPTTRSDLAVAVWHGTSYVIGGYDGRGTPTQILQLRPHTPAVPVGRLVRGVRYAATAVAGGTAYVFGGEVLGHELDAVQAVDLRTGRSRPVARLPVPLGHAMAATVGARILVMGGRVTPTSQTAAMWWFDPGTGGFSRAGRLPAPLSDAAVATYRREIWLLGGEDPAVTGSVVFVNVR